MRYWGLAVLGLAALAGCGGGGSTNAPQGYALDPALARAVPADTIILGAIRMDRARQSPLYQEWQAKLPATGLDELKSRFGVDPRADLDELVAAYNGKEMFTLLRGRFKSGDLAAKLTEAGGERADHGGRTLVKRGDTGVAFLSGTVAAAGPLPLLHAAIGAKGAGKPSSLLSNLTSVPVDAHVWVLTTGGATLNFPQGSNAGNIDKVLSTLQSLSGWANFDQGLRIALRGTATDADAAKRLHTQLRGLIGMGRLSAPDNRPEMLKLYDAIEIKQVDKTIKANANASAELLKQVLAK
ncbi:MAG: hypothetical protein FJW31_23255 [Acidobacteria bacterium]|nr:hypothetical protein [Acidobacteriota bacterium]